MAGLSSIASVGELGLRSRKKAKRRDEIIAAAAILFARQGIDQTSMADIAAAAGISIPTVFNYFGSKDGVLIALISDGTSDAREQDRDQHWREGADLGTLMVELYVRVSRRTLEIADKRLWRYAESAVIRHPTTELALQYQGISDALVDVVAEFIDSLELRLRHGQVVSAPFMARLFQDVWMPCFLSFITHEEQSLAAHEVMLRERMLPLVDMLFDESCAKAPQRKGKCA
ncbi:TetR/AcrR family transcriptional regulator [Rhizobium sp. RU36D]|uniref:TetR/AcrR family transcriptional regulator n=1 Tax=Rhizobium sp. RU36D TaxID=1907415 RepID=UPI0009D7FFD4|nr:TetR/AcrR family transcriptional regulator [Rhizobium sp. RU36D]SMC80103.1 transcriptional regulator, TetR family [Rhizobium sp. RU36D]